MGACCSSSSWPTTGYGIHGKWFRLSKELFDEIHYKSMAYFKLSIFLFNLATYLAFHLIG